MKTRTLSRGLIRLRKCVALLATCSLLLMIFAPASQAYLAPNPSDPVPMEFDSKDGHPWEEIDYSNKPSLITNRFNSDDYVIIISKAVYSILLKFNIIEIKNKTRHNNCLKKEIDSHAKFDKSQSYICGTSATK